MPDLLVRSFAPLLPALLHPAQFRLLLDLDLRLDPLFRPPDLSPVSDHLKTQSFGLWPGRGGRGRRGV